MAKGSIGSVLANSVFYTFGNMLLKVFSFFLIPLYTAYLQPDQYGYEVVRGERQAVL